MSRIKKSRLIWLYKYVFVGHNGSVYDVICVGIGWVGCEYIMGVIGWVCVRLGGLVDGCI